MNVISVDSDQCDACPSEAHVAAYVYAELKSGKSLSLCAHHGRQHMVALIEQGATVVDMTHLVHA